MKTLERNSLAAMEFELYWQSPEAGHRESFFAPNVNMWRDIFPPGVEEKILGARENETFSFEFKPGKIVPEFSFKKVQDVSPDQLREINISGLRISPQLGRFYPAGLLKNVPGIFPQTLEPLRVIGIEEDRVQVDLNHPLSHYELEWTLKILSIRQSAAERGGRCNDWFEEVSHSGPGMQARYNSIKTVFEHKHCYARVDENKDSRFYTSPRLTGHIDAQASSMLQALYARHLNRNDKVLDLMSSVQSHLPQNYNLTITGLGLNNAEMKKNPLLSEYFVHDLNATSFLPFNDNTFGAVVCSLSIEYLIRPREIISEINRVLMPDGKVLISFSNRWFPPKVTRLWLELHDFERMGLILDYLLENGQFANLHTFSVRNWPRPSRDRYAGHIANSDPIFFITGSKKIL